MTHEKAPKNLTNAQKKFLRRLGHDLSPMVYIGKEGLTETVAAAVDDSLYHHELIKVKIINTDKITKHEAAEQIPPRTGSLLVQLIGKTLLLYRPNDKKKKEEQIRLPGN
jgi:RNA-binding protein